MDTKEACFSPSMECRGPVWELQKYHGINGPGFISRCFACGILQQ